MRNARAIGRINSGGSFRARAYPTAIAPRINHPPTTTLANTRSERSGNTGRSNALLLTAIISPVLLIIAFAYPLTRASGAEAPPPDLIHKIAHHEDETVEERKNYAYRQSVRLAEINEHGAEVGRYSEVRDVIFSPEHARSEKLVSLPLQNLKNLQLTDQDFEDLREIQPFVLREDMLHNYDVKFRGEEKMDGVDCWVIQIRPRQILQSQRFFDGLLWAAKDGLSIVRTEGQAVPQIYSTHQENLFPHFTTIRKPVNGNFWFPAVTYADDTLPFHTGPLRIKLNIRYTNYQKFGSSSIVTFDDK